MKRFPIQSTAEQKPGATWPLGIISPFALALTLLILTTSSFAVGRTPVRVGVYNYNPVVFRSADGQLQGIAITILKFVAERENWDLQFIEGDWSECLERLEANQIDIVPGAGYTAERARRYRFNAENLIKSVGVIYTGKDTDIKTIDDLAGKTIGLHIKGIHREAFEKLAFNRGMVYRGIDAKDSSAVLELIETGQADAGIVSLAHGKIYVKNAKNIAPSPILFNPTHSRFIGPKNGNPDFLNTIDHYLQRLISDKDSIYHSELKRLGIDHLAVINVDPGLPNWLKIALVGTLSAALLLFGMNFLLKRQVKSKKLELAKSNTTLKRQINERLEAEKVLKFNENRLSTLMGNLPGVIYRCRNDAKLSFEFLNKNDANLFGPNAPSLQISKDVNGLQDMVHPSDTEIVNKRRSTSAGNGSSYNTVYRIRMGPSRYQYISDRGVCLFDDNEQLIAFEGFISEITSTQEIEIRLRQENARLRRSMKERFRFGDIIGKSRPMQRVYELIMKAAASEDSVVIYGESGTGKELVARAIHETSARAEQEFVPVNCGAIPESLIESEFFGYCKGAFTGADSDKVGLLTLADGGTLFLDEIGDIPPALQVKLLRAIEGGGYTPVGGKQVRRPDLRIVAATNKDLNALVADGRMRSDFFYRISVLTITLPPLRDRQDDIALLIEHFLEQLDAGGHYIPTHVMDAFKDYRWPGNIRELRNAVGRYLTLNEVSFIEKQSSLTDDSPSISNDSQPTDNPSLRSAVERFEKYYIQRLLDRYGWNRSRVAETLEINRRTLFNKIKSHSLTPDA